MVKVANSLAGILQTDPPSAEGREACTADVLQLPAGVKASATALLFPENLAIEDWVQVGDALQRYESGVQWWLGDWWHYGAHKYGERIKIAAQGVFNYKFGTMANYGYVAGAVKPSCRNEVLSFSHHYPVAPLPPNDQNKWLKRAARFKWSAAYLRSKIVESKTLPITDAKRAQRLVDYFKELAQQALSVGMLVDFDPAYLSVGILEELKALASEVVTAWSQKVEELDKLIEVTRSAPPPVPKSRRLAATIDDDGNRYWVVQLPSGELIEEPRDEPPERGMNEGPNIGAIMEELYYGPR